MQTHKTTMADIKENDDSEFGLIVEVIANNEYEVVFNVVQDGFEYDPYDDDTYEQYDAEPDDEIIIYF